MVFKINWGLKLNAKDYSLDDLKKYLSGIFSKECKSGEYSEADLYEVVVCGKVFAELNSEADFHSKEKEIAKNTANFVKENLNCFGYQFLYSDILRTNVLVRSEFGKENQVFDMSVDKIVKCYKNEGGRVVSSDHDIMFKYDKMGFEVIEVNSGLEMFNSL